MIGGGITNTLDLGGGQKIQDYLAGAGVSNQGPGGGTLYTQGQERKAGFNPRPVIDTSSQQYQDLFEKYRPGIDGTYISGFGPVTQNRTYLDLPSMQDMTALGYYDPNPMTREHKGPRMAQFMNDLYRQPASGDANLGFGSVQNPGGISAMEAAGIMGQEDNRSLEEKMIEMYGSLDNIPHTNLGPSIMDPGSSGTAQIPEGFMRPGGLPPGGFFTADFDDIQNVNPGGQIITSPGQEIDSQSPSQQPAFFPQQPTQQPTGGFDSKAFANELLTGIGDLFKQHFPDSAQMAFNNSNQPQSQIEQPIQDATTFDVQPQQNTAYNPFSVNTIGGAFGGGY